MQLPFDLDDVRMICVDGDKVRFVLPAGHVEVVVDSCKSLDRNASPVTEVVRGTKHTFFDDGIYGI
jgi:hypothetical protein